MDSKYKFQFKGIVKKRLGKEVIREKILYVVNNDTTTGIALEVAEFINKKQSDFYTVIYYKNSPYPSYTADQDLINIGARFSLDLNAFKKAYFLIKKMQPKVIHVHHTISALVFFIFGKIACPSARLVKTIHSSHNSLRWSQQIINFFIYLMADKLLCNSVSTRKSFSALYRYLFYYKTDVCYNGVNIHKIRNAPRIKKNISYLTDKNIIVGSVGRFIPVKDYKTLINAFAEIQKRRIEDFSLLLIGDGKERNKLEKLAREKEIHDAVIFTGALNRNLVYSYLKEIDIFAVTSLDEGFCNALVEAMAAEKAIVCSGIEILKEVAGDGALFAEPGNPESFSRQILNLFENKKLFKETKKRAGQRAAIFSIESCAERYIEHYRNIKSR